MILFLKQQVAIDKIGERMGESQKRLTKKELIYNIRSLYLSALSLQEVITSYGLEIGILLEVRGRVSPCPTLPIALESEVKLAQLPIYGEVLIRKH